MAGLGSVSLCVFQRCCEMKRGWVTTAHTYRACCDDIHEYTDIAIDRSRSAWVVTHGTSALLYLQWPSLDCMFTLPVHMLAYRCDMRYGQTN